MRNYLRKNERRHQTIAAGESEDVRLDDAVGRKGRWGNFPRSVLCPVEWLDAYWTKYGIDLP